MVFPWPLFRMQVSSLRARGFVCRGTIWGPNDRPGILGLARPSSPELKQGDGGALVILMSTGEEHSGRLTYGEHLLAVENALYELVSFRRGETEEIRMSY